MDPEMLEKLAVLKINRDFMIDMKEKMKREKDLKNFVMNVRM